MRDWLKDKKEIGIVGLMQLSIVLFLLGYHAWANTCVIIGFALVLFTIELGSLKSSLKSRDFLLFISYLLTTFIAVFWSDDMSSGFKYVELRLLLFIFPFIFYHIKLQQKNVNLILMTFVFGLFFSLLLGFANSFHNYLQTADTGYFYNDNLVDIIDKQATYFSVFINIALIIISFLYQYVNKHQKFIFIIITPILILGQLLLAVRISILTLFVLALISMLYFFFKTGSKKSIFVGLGIVSVIVALIYIFPQTYNRFKSMASNFEYQFDNPNPVNHFNGEITSENWNGLNLRLALWHCGWDIIKDQPLFGVGTGDYKEALRGQFASKNFKYAQERDFGIHNQFLYTWMTFGIFGLLLFSTAIVLPIFTAAKEVNYLYIAFLVVIIMAFLTENLLNKYIGVYAFGLFNSLLYFRHKQY